jgi:hypothetical protein
MKKLVSALLIIFIIFNIAYFLFYKQKKDDQIQDSKMPSSINFLNSNMKISDRYFLLENWKDSISLSAIVKDGSVLVLRMPRVSCEQCKFAELENLKLLFSNDNIKNVCAILTTSSPRELKMLTQTFNYRYLKVGSLQNELINISEEKQKRPYYFVLDSNLRADNFFFPDMRNQKLTEAYLKRIKKQFLKI